MTNMLYAQDVESIKIGDKMTKAKVIAKFGEPDSYQIYNADETYRYGDNCLQFNKYDGLCNVSIEDNRYRLLLEVTPSGIKVRDSLSVFNTLSCGKPKYDDKLNQYVLYGGNDFSSPLYINVENGVITAFNFYLMP